MSNEKATHSGADNGPVPQIMSTPPTPSTKARRVDRERDTGFPEPFGDNYNTTLPHPEADLSPNAVISQEDLSSERFMKRRRLSMLSKHRRTHSSSTNASSQQIPELILPPEEAEPRTPSLAPSSIREAGASMESIREDDEYTPPTSPEMASSEYKRRSFLGKLRRR